MRAFFVLTQKAQLTDPFRRQGPTHFARSSGRRRGFTLVETVITASILCLLALVIAPSVAPFDPVLPAEPYPGGTATGRPGFVGDVITKALRQASVADHRDQPGGWTTLLFPNFFFTDVGGVSYVYRQKRHISSRNSAGDHDPGFVGRSAVP
jgi:prepilin-type N-terminal cleavage/methylation domain-containing protein